jgi:hypothetical protein
MLNPSIASEVTARAAEGYRHVCVAQFCAEFAALGYRIDRSMDCHSVSRYAMGPRAGQTYPACTTGIREADTGRSAFHFEARRDAAFTRMQALRQEVFATLPRGAILEV